MKVSQSHFQYGLLTRVWRGHHNGLSLFLCFFIFSLDLSFFLDDSLDLSIIIDSNNSADAEVRISGDRIMDFKRLLERILINLRRLDLGKVVLDVDKIFVGDDRHQELLIIFKESIAHEGC